MSLIGVERGSGVLVLESESRTLVDVPAYAFDAMISSIERLGAGDAEMRKALLVFEALFDRPSDVEGIELIGESGRSMVVNQRTLERIRELHVNEAAGRGEEARCVVGRVLELDLAKKTFRIHDSAGETSVVAFSDAMEPLVTGALNMFVTVQAIAGDRKILDLVSLEASESMPPSRFNDRTSLDEIARAQGISALEAFDEDPFPGIEPAPLESFQAFIKTARGGRGTRF